MSQDSISRFFPGWHVVRQIGVGGFGAVYEIERVHFGTTEKAALKVMRVPHSSSVIDDLRANGYDDYSIQRRIKATVDEFSEEYNNMRKLTHTNIVNCDDIQSERDDNGFGYTLYIKMELLTPLMQSVAGHYDCEKVAVKVAKDICSALELCRSRNVVHRDIKPQNLFVNEYGDYKLGDFGIAREMEHTMAASASGTPPYMAPEVYLHQEYSPNVDIYSLGLVLYWLLNEKRLPFVPAPPQIATAQDESMAMFRRVKGEEPFPAPKYGSAELKRIVLKACNPDRRKRYQSAAEMTADLNALGSKRSAGVNDRVERVEYREKKGYISDERTVPADNTQQIYKKPKRPFFGSSGPDVFYTILLLIWMSVTGLYFICTAPGAGTAIKNNPELTARIIGILAGAAAVFGLTIFAFVKRHVTPSRIKTMLTILYATVWLVPVVSDSLSGLGKSADKPYIQVEENYIGHDNVSIIKSSEQADWLFDNLKEQSSNKYKYYVFEDCTVESGLEAVKTDSGYYNAHINLDGSRYEIRLSNSDLGTENKKSAFEKLDTSKHYDMVLELSYNLNMSSLTGDQSEYFLLFDSADESSK